MYPCLFPKQYLKDFETIKKTTEMRYISILFLFFVSAVSAQRFQTVFEKSNGTKTATYNQAIDYYKQLASVYPEISMHEMGMTDSGKKLHLVVFSTDKAFSFKNFDSKSKNTILINNGIHPGEPDGIDASMMLLRDIVQSEKLKKKYKDLIICVIPVYNIGGSLNRNSHSRVNQNGPESYGFRGNARNFDLNRDFIKTDTKNAKAFAEIFHWVDPDIFIDNHVSNGADYQYALTHLFTQHNKLGGQLGVFLNKKMKPDMVSDLDKKGWIITPYVNVFNRVPDSGFSQFFDSPRYSTGYTTLFNTLGFMVETHMLKPYKQRVEGTYELMITALDFLKKNGKTISRLRKENDQEFQSLKTYPIQWEIDSSKTSTLQFKGFEGEFIKSDVTGLKRLKYNRSKPFVKPVTYYNYYKPKKEVKVPEAYIIPQGLYKVIERLENNKIKMIPLMKDSLIEVEISHIKDYQTRKSAYEGHYVHYNTRISKNKKKIAFKKGDILIPVKQSGIRYLVETLEPEAPDSFFNWNFFDTILQRKEGFSPYVFEDLAVQILNEDANLKSAFEQKKDKDVNFKNSWYDQLNFIYKNSKYQEKAHMQYPVFRIIN